MERKKNRVHILKPKILKTVKLHKESIINIDKIIFYCLIIV